MGLRRRSRRLAAVLTAAGLALGTAACGSGSGSARAGDPNTLEVWTRSDPDSAVTYDRVFAAFTKKTGIKIDYQPVVNFDQQLQSRAIRQGPAGRDDQRHGADGQLPEPGTAEADRRARPPPPPLPGVGHAPP